MIVEDAAESFCAAYNGIQTGCFGDISIVSANGNNVSVQENHQLSWKPVV